MFDENKWDKSYTYWEGSDSDIGVWRFMINGDEIFSVVSADRHYRGISRAYTCKYVLTMCIWGSSHSHDLAADSIEEAKIEGERWLVENIKNRIDVLKKSIHYFEDLLSLITSEPKDGDNHETAGGN